MQVEEILQITGTILGSLGGGAVVVFGLSAWLGKVWAERLMRHTTLNHEKELIKIRDLCQSELEKLRIKLKKSEFLFEKEFSAASALVEFHEAIIPLSQHPDMHMDDVFAHIADEFEEIETWTKKFVSTHGAVLPTKVATDLMMAARTCGEHKFDTASPATEAGEPKFDAAESVYENIRSARDDMRSRVWDQAST